MKRMVLIAMGLLLLAGSSFAQPYPGLPDTAYVGLFTDLAHTTHQVNYTATPPAMTPFTFYIFWVPSKMGLMAAEFKIQYPANVLITSAVKNPAVIIEMGSIQAGISISFYGEVECGESCCRTDWVYSHRVNCFLMNANPGQIMVVERLLDPEPPAYQVGSCEPGYPIYPVKRYCHLSLNYDGGVGVQTKSWGAIKSLF
ncbi:MAG: hypothetical protein NTW97_07370 [Candidatus Krumholzibacteria bacterium]|nr:hypothetical protein [Candidatus Krumholzibacteria bacterium]